MGCGRRSLRVTTLSWGWVIRPLGSCSCLGLEPRSKSILPLKETLFSVHSIHGKGGQETIETQGPETYRHIPRFVKADSCDDINGRDRIPLIFLVLRGICGLLALSDHEIVDEKIYPFFRLTLTPAFQ